MNRGCFLALVVVFNFSFVPAIASDAPAKEDTKLTVKSLRELVGKGHFSRELRDFRELMGRRPAAYYPFFDSGFFHNWKCKGVSLWFDEDCKVNYIILYADKYEDFQRYEGELPEKLSFADTTTDVTTKLGKPEEVFDGTGSVTTQWRYPTKGLSINFDTKSSPGPDTRIGSVILYMPEKRP
jgi:hypothetical protein